MAVEKPYKDDHQSGSGQILPVRHQFIVLIPSPIKILIKPDTFINIKKNLMG